MQPLNVIGGIRRFAERRFRLEFFEGELVRLRVITDLDCASELDLPLQDHVRQRSSTMLGDQAAQRARPVVGVEALLTRSSWLPLSRAPHGALRQPGRDLTQLEVHDIPISSGVSGGRRLSRPHV